MNDTAQPRHLPATDILQGRNTRLRLPRQDELTFIRTLWGDPETMAPVGGPIDLPEPKALEWFARMVTPGDGTNCYCLILNSEDTPVGEVSFHKWDPERRSAHLNIKVMARHRRRGYAKDSLGTFLACFFGRIGGRLMTDDVALDNPNGRKLMDSAGFIRDDSVADVCRMVLSRQTFIKHHSR